MRKIYYLSKSSDLGQQSVLGHAVIQDSLSDKKQLRVDLFFSSSVIPSEVRLFLYKQTDSPSNHNSYSASNFSSHSVSESISGSSLDSNSTYEPSVINNSLTALEISLSLSNNTGKPCLSGYFPAIEEYWFELVLPDCRLQFGTKPVLKIIPKKTSNNVIPAPKTNVKSENNYRNSDNIISQKSISLWDKLKNRFGCSSYFSEQYEGISLTPSEIHRFTIQDQSLEENSFLLHGYYQYKHILLLRSNSSKQDPSYYIGVPGIWQKQEKIVAGMFGFSSFKAMHFSTEKKVIHQTVPPSGTFGYYLREIQFVDCCK